MDDYNFDPSMYFLGSLCKNEHKYLDTDKSLRLLSRKRCIQCEKNSDKRKYQRHREEISQRSKKYYVKNKEKCLQRAASYRAENKEYIKHWKAEHYKKNRERILKRNAEDRQKNLEGWKEYYSRWRQTPAGKLSRNGSERKRRIRKKTNYSFPYTTTQLKERFRDFDNCCAYCGNAATSIEHFFSISSGGADVIGNILPACGKCNSSKYNHDALVWYKSQKFYTKKRWQKILRILGLSENTLGQMPLF